MEESGWKNVHGDVFRPPQYPMILSSLLGSGIQLFCMVLIVICKYDLRMIRQHLSRIYSNNTSVCVCVCYSCGHAWNVVSIQSRGSDDHVLLFVYVYGVSGCHVLVVH